MCLILVLRHSAGRSNRGRKRFIQLAKRMARGCKNFVCFRTAAYHRAGKLKLAVPTT
jgi:hypothetical protein